ncbi:hypothetical protein L5515_003801 [Caenorhabditis briggsae]|uniref:C2 domain-containing protein n=1 Tax=Caenorhabditis briggsae TaxID=6238 RepID=A0AAE9EJS0_CAEBR|nr:hypothetical protein L5515_003801 [Caenorhabditis briggsae]
MSSFAYMFLMILLNTVHAELWMHVNVVSVERKACPIDETSWGTETNGCASMSYMTLDERIVPHHERRSSSFEYVNGIPRPTVTHWPKGRLADWMISIQFISVDPVYGLARTCDRSGYIRVFQNEISNLNFQPEFVEKTLQIQGQCFTATVKVQASSDVCPWCVDESKTTTTTTTTTLTPSSSPEALFSFDSNNTSVLIAMVVLAIFSFLALTATTALLVVYIIDRKKPEFFDLPPPQANSTVLARSDQTDIFTSKSSERWTEYGCETWASFQPLKISPRETCVYKVTQEDEEDSSDSGNASLQ